MKTKIEKYIKTWEKQCYSKGIPDKLPIEIEQKTNQPSYRKICLAILKNDYPLKSLGFQAKKSEVYDCLKKKELMERGVIKSVQLKIF